MRALGQAYAVFDQELVRALDPNNSAVKIEPPEFQAMAFDFKSVDVRDSFTEKNFVVKSIDAIVRNPMSFSLVGLVAFVALILGYLDMGFFWSVQRAFANDMDRIRKAGKNTIRQMRDLLEALNTHLNRGPFRSMYTPDGAPSPIDAEFARERFKQVMTGLSEADRFETVEEGLMMGVLRRFHNERTPVHSLGKELMAFLDGIRRIESPAIRAFHRLTKAVGDYTSDSMVFEDGVMRLGEGSAAISPSDLIIAIRDQGKATTGTEMAARFREEMAARIGCKPVEAGMPGESLADRTRALEGKIQALLLAQNLGEEAWVLDMLDVQEELAELKESPVLIEGEQRQRDALMQSYQTLIQALNVKLGALTAQAEGGIKAVKRGMDANREEEARHSYDPEFDRLEGAIEGARYVLREGVFASEVNPNVVFRTLDEHLKEIAGIDDELKKLTPDPTLLRDRKLTLRDRCRAVHGELEDAKTQFKGEVLEGIHTNRGNGLMAWSDRHLSGGALTPETARDFTDAFVVLYQRFYQGAPDFVEVQAGEDLDAPNISRAFDHFALELRKNLDSFGFDEGTSRKYDFAWRMGMRLQEAYKALEVSERVTVPEKLPALRLLTQRT